jgi:hydroxyacid-oxoacid transhydrogenase
MSYPVLRSREELPAPGYASDHPLVPHGVSVILNAPACFVTPRGRIPIGTLQAAAALGANVTGVKSEDAGRVLADRITWFMRELKVPNGLKAIGYSSSDINTLVEGTLPQHRVTKLSPRPAGPEDWGDSSKTP